ncbi:MAG TPA: AarF/UbiB family protein [Flavipsychrobacter sp.]|nr:AarF/UbiB family protein [Flavipsychrobacter sp.]
MNFVPEKLQRYFKFIGFLIKYWNSDVVNQAANSTHADEIAEATTDTTTSYEKPEELVEDLKNMGPTWVKLGQLLSTRPDLLPDEYLKALGSLQDNVSEVPYEEILPIIEEELGVRVSKGFAELDERPLASASIGQVHKAVLRSGVEVAVKIQRPGIRKKFAEDLEILKEVIGLATKYSKTIRKYALDEILEEMHHILLNELDYSKEAKNLVTLGANLQEYRKLLVPQPINGYCTGRVLTMEYISGQKVTAISALVRTENDFSPLVDDLVECYLKQIIVDGFAHADPHPGNVHLTSDYNIVLMDLGMVAKFSHTVQDKLLKLLIALGNLDGDAVTDALLNLSEYSKDVNTDPFRQHINRMVLDNHKYAAKEMTTGKLLIQINRLAAEEGIKIRPELNIVGKILVNLDLIVAALAPEFDLQASIRKHLEKILRQKLLGELKPEHLLGTLVELKNLGKNLPGRINAITEKIANNELEIKIDAIDEKRFTDGFQKVANRITLGLIIAAMIIGASMLMRVPSAFTILGYPVLAMAFFLVAAIAGFSLMYIIVFKDEDYRKKG